MKKKKIYNKVLILLAVLLVTGCEKQYTWHLKSQNINAIVVDGIITNELKTQIVKLSKVNSEINSENVPVTGATIEVTDSTKKFIFNESTTEPGTYISSPFQAVVGKIYYLTITYQEKSYSASAQMVGITPLDSVNLILENGLYKYIHIKSGEPAIIEIFLDWSAVPEYCTIYGSCYAQETFYTLNNVDINSILSPEKETIYFPAGTTLIRTKYSLSAEHQNFIRSLLMETEWRGGVFDVQQGNVTTNLTNGALGFFGACMVLTDTTLVK